MSPGRHDKIEIARMFRTFLSQLLRNPVYAQADLELYEFFKSQGAAIVNDASDFAGTNGCYLYQGRDVKEDKDRCLKDQTLVIAPHEALISSDTWLKCRKKLMAIPPSSRDGNRRTLGWPEKSNAGIVGML